MPYNFDSQIVSGKYFLSLNYNIICLVQDYQRHHSTGDDLLHKTSNSCVLGISVSELCCWVLTYWAPNLMICCKHSYCEILAPPSALAKRINKWKSSLIVHPKQLSSKKNPKNPEKTSTTTTKKKPPIGQQACLPLNVPSEQWEECFTAQFANNIFPKMTQ